MGAELRIHFPGAGERLTLEFAEDARSHIVTPAKMSERYQHAIQDVSAVAVHSHFRWFDADGRLVAPKYVHPRRIDSFELPACVHQPRSCTGRVHRE